MLSKNSKNAKPQKTLNSHCRQFWITTFWLKLPFDISTCFWLHNISEASFLTDTKTYILLLLFLLLILLLSSSSSLLGLLLLTIIIWFDNFRYYHYHCYYHYYDFNFTLISNTYHFHFAKGPFSLQKNSIRS